MKKRVIVVTAAMLLGASSAVSADVGIGAKASTLGAGVELGASLTDSINARVAFNRYSRSDNQTIDDIKYSASLDLNSTALFLDWHPLGGGFHVTGGYLFSNNELNADATPATNVTIGDTTYAPSDVGKIDASVKLGSGPYLGVGWGNVPAKGFGFTVELGVVQMAKPDVSLKIDDPNGVIAANNDIAKEQANMEKDLDNFETYPVVSVGLSFGF